MRFGHDGIAVQTAHHLVNVGAEKRRQRQGCHVGDAEQQHERRVDADPERAPAGHAQLEFPGRKSAEGVRVTRAGSSIGSCVLPAVKSVEMGAIVEERVRMGGQIVASKEINGETKIGSEEQRQEQQTHDR